MQHIAHGQAAGNRPRATKRPSARLSLADVTKEKTKNRAGVGGVDRGDVGPERDLVADEGGHRVGLGVAANEAQQRLVIDLAPLAVGQAQRFPEAHPQHARAQGVLERLAHAQVGRQRQHSEELGQPDVRGGRRVRHERPA